MSVVAPPKARPADDQTLAELEALFEEARGRARRRRRRSAAWLLVTGAAGAYIGLGGVGGSARPPASPASKAPFVADGALDRSAMLAGRLTLVDFGSGPVGPETRGWHGLKVLDRQGRLRPFIRCPDTVEYCGIVEGVDWSPAGNRLAYTIGAHGAMNPYIGLHVLNIETGLDRRIPDGAVCALVDRSDLAWSPDGSQIAYTCTPAAGSRRAIVIIDWNGDARRLRTQTAGIDSSPTWSPRGDRIAFATKVAGVGSTVSTVGVDTRSRVVLASDASAPDWSPDGTRIAYRTGCGGVKLVTPQGRDVTPVRGPFRCRAIGVDGTPVWLPDSQRIVINNGTGIYVVNRDGSGLRRLTTRTGIGPHGGRPTWRP